MDIKNIKKIDLLLGIIVIIFFFWILLKYTVNIPVNDDYGVLDNFNKLICSNSFSEKLKFLFAQHNEHRIVYDRLWFLISYKINSQINFNLLSFVGNLSLLGIFLLLRKRTLIFKDNYFILFPLSVLIFNLSFHENITFPMASLANFTVILFSLLSIYYLTLEEKKAKNILFSLIFFLFAVYTQAGGLFVLPTALVLLFLRKEYKTMLYFAIVGFLICLIYFIGYEKPFNSPSIIQSISSYNINSLLYTITFLGNAFANNLIYTNNASVSILVSSIVGAIFLLIYFYQLKCKYYNRNAFNFSVMTLVIVLSIITGITRSGLGLETAISSRYRIISVLFFISVLILLFEFIKLKKINGLKINGLIVLFTVFYFFNYSYSQEQYLYFREKQSIKGVVNYYSGNHKLLNGFQQDYYKQVLEKSNEEETYYLPLKEEIDQNLPLSSPINIKTTNLESTSLNVTIDEVTKLYDSYYIEGWAFIDDIETLNQKVYIGLNNNNNYTFFNTKQVNRYDLNPYFKKNYLKRGGFFARIKLENINQGLNKITVFVENTGTKKMIETDKDITN